ncbi:MAG: tetratricopeptide repeat protein [Bacteroidetes bacterium]|nr:tetratricopeptide repeat protein [Bacteroidota bacterium]
MRPGKTKISDNLPLIERKGKPSLRYFFILIGIILVTGLVYRESLKGAFLSYDDIENVVNNPLIQHLALSNIPKFFSVSTLYMFTPLTFLSYAVNYGINGLDPYWFRLTNLLLHMVNVTLVFFLSFHILKKQKPSIIIAALFALNPMNVDSVSWISSRSNLLCTLFFLLSLICYLKYRGKSSRLFYGLSLVTFILSLLSKSSGIMLPFTLLLLDYYQNRQMKVKIFYEKIPYFIIALIIGLITVYFRTDTGNPQTVIDYSVPDRCFLFFYSILAYFIKTIIPFHLSEIYAYPLKINGLLPFLYYLAPVIITGLIVLLVKLKVNKKIVIFGLGFFLLNIIITQVALLEDGFHANRYAYLPGIGIIFILSVILFEIFEQSSTWKYLVLFILVIIVSGNAFVTRKRSLVWMDTMLLFDHAIKKSPGSAFAYNNRGIAKYNTNDVEGALSDYTRAIAENPGYAGAFYNRGITYYNDRQFEKAMGDYTRAIALNPHFFSCYTARGVLEMDVLQNDSLAMVDYNRAIEVNPSFAQAYYNRGILALRRSDLTNACKDFQIVKKLGYSRADELIHRYCR